MLHDASAKQPGPPSPAGGIRAGLIGLASSGLAWVVLGLFPEAEMAVFARGAASLAALLTGSPVDRAEEGWLLAGQAQPVLVSAVCSATGYFLAVVALVGWRLGQFRLPAPQAMLVAVAAGLPVTLLINALRVVVVMHAHRWVIPQFPAAYAPFLHMFAGVAIFLPALIGLNLIFEYHGNRHRRACP